MTVPDPLSTPSTSPELLELLKKAAERKPTAEELLEQRIGFVWSGLGSESNLTKEDVRRILLEQEEIAQESETEWVKVPRKCTEAMRKAAGETPGMKAVGGAFVLQQARNGKIADNSDWGGLGPLEQAWEAMLKVGGVPVTEEPTNPEADYKVRPVNVPALPKPEFSAGQAKPVHMDLYPLRQVMECCRIAMDAQRRGPLYQPTQVWVTSDKNNMFLFDQETTAKTFLSGFPPSVSGGYHSTLMPVFRKENLVATPEEKSGNTTS